LAKYHTVFRNEYTERLSFLCRAVNFLEDVLEDAECDDLLVSVEGRGIAVEPVNCRYSVLESIDVFRDQHSLENVTLGFGVESYRALYDRVFETYLKGLHPRTLDLLARSRATGYEYYIGVLFDGRAFVLEGEKDRITLPSISQCFSAHTHPYPNPLPSTADLKTITQMLLSRGVGHVISSFGGSLAVYRVRPLSEEDFELLREAERLNPLNALKPLAKLKSIKVIRF